MIFRHLLNMRSHPTWVRGLKLTFTYNDEHLPQSHPTWVRGLKRVALQPLDHYMGRTLRGCVD